jgi:hypothetical protein
MYYCDPKWHGGRLVDAAFLIQPLYEGAEAPLPKFAACKNHAGHALQVMTSQYHSVEVCEVSNRKARKPVPASA